MVCLFYMHLNKSLKLSTLQGCDMRNIKRVVLWELPPSFCALVQRAGRAARDFSTLCEAILIVPQSVITKGTSEMEVEAALEAVQTESEN